MAALVEKLVALVSRAFYADEHIVVLQALIREKFLKDDEMGSAVNLQTRQVRKIIAELHQDHIVSTEVLNDKRQGGSSSMNYWYINYKKFVDVVKYRLYKINEFLKEREQLEIERQTYQCSNENCARDYTALEAQRLIVPGQFEFLCGHCNEKLKECNNNDRLDSIQDLQKKFKGQMNKQEGLHDGITEVLRRIGDYINQGNVLPRNLPSENRAAGIGGNSTQAVISARSGGGGGTGGGRSRGGKRGAEGELNNEQSYLYLNSNHEKDIVVDIAGADAEDDYSLGSKRKNVEEHNDQPQKKVQNLPEFLKGSTISGHMNLKHENNRLKQQEDLAAAAHMDQEISNSDSLHDSMTEEQRQQAYKQAYLKEYARYIEETDEKVEVQVDKAGWKAEMEDDDYEDDEELEDIEWEWCEEEPEIMLPDGNSIKEKFVPVNGTQKRAIQLTEEDLDQMSDVEYKMCYFIFYPISE